jgi:hypothetical protein
MGEFNAFAYGSVKKEPFARWLPNTKSLMAYCKAHGLGWAYFAYWGANEIVIHNTDYPLPQLLPVLQDAY